MNIIEQINLKFTSGNDVGVSRVVLTKEEWDQIKTLLRDVKPQNGDYVPNEGLCGEEYTPHYGGPCPKDVFDKEVSVLFRDGTTNTPPSLAGRYWAWKHYDEDDDIVGYKLI